MNRIRIGRRGITVATVTFAVLALAGGIAYATIPDGNKVFTACMLKSTGTVRLIDKSLPDSNPMSHCSPTLEIQVTWNQQGQQGAPGAPGATGPAGPAGPAGKDGVDGKDGQSVTNAAEAPGASCPNGGARFSVGDGLPTFACNGRDGKDGKDGVDGTNGTNGTNGVDGADGKDGASVTNAVEPAGTNCANGGSKFTGASGVTYACNGAPGGLSGYQIGFSTPSAPPGFTNITLGCPPGKKFIGAGHGADSADVTLIRSQPFGSDWLFQFFNRGSVTHSVEAYLICATG